MSKYLIACGGTGGHLTPGIAVAEELVKRDHACKLLISRKEVDSRVIRRYPEFDYIRMPGVGFSKNPLKWFKFFSEQMKALVQSLKLLRTEKPAAVISFGGFTSVGILMAAFLKRTPIILYEVNRVMGKAIQMFSGVADRLYLPLEVEFKQKKKNNCVRYVGYPLRSSIRPMIKEIACGFLGLDPRRKRLLVWGGSQGAAVLNRWVSENFEKLSQLGVDVCCVTGPGQKIQRPMKSTNSKGSQSETVFIEFIDNVAEYLCSADLVISRAGAGSIAELVRCARPNILIPYPLAAANHQLANAQFLESQGGTIIVEEKDIDHLYSKISDLFSDQTLLGKMERILSFLSKDNSVAKVVDDIETIAKKSDEGQNIHSKPETVYMLGVGGMGMCPLAIYLRQAGYRVMGYDNFLQSAVKEILVAEGVEVIMDASALPPADCLIYSSAIAPEHPLYVQAKQMGIPTIRRGEYLAKVLKDKKLIAIVGSHGKTSTTALLIHALKAEGFSFSYLLGALFNDRECPPAMYSESEWVVAEVDESDGTIEHFSPEITLAVNFDWDHPDKYASPQALIDTFKRLFGRTRQAIFYPSECNVLKKILAELPIKKISFGEEGVFEANIIEAKEKTLIAFQKNSEAQIVEVPMLGEFNGRNAMAALAVVKYLYDAFRVDIFEGYLGVRRRQEVLFESKDLDVLMDYAHHPTEIQALLAFAKKTWKDSKLLVIFQPHRYTRTKQYYSQFAEVLRAADQLILMPVYAASEPYDPEGATEMIYRKLEDQAKAILLKNFDDELYSLLPDINSLEQPSVILFVGAGDIEKKAKYFQKLLREMNFKKQAMERLSTATPLLEYEPLANKTTIGVGGNARFYAEPAHLEDLILLVKLTASTKVPLFILGRGSNLIVADSGFDGLVVRLNQPYWRRIERLDDQRAWVHAGARLKEICGTACKWGFSGFEFLEGIPGTLGGALRMNAGAMGGWLFDVIESVQFLTYEGEIVEKKANELELGYRFCKELKSAIALGAVLKSPFNQDTSKIMEVIESFSKKRKESQPREPSAGCIFKNPTNNFAGKLIEVSGLKGARVGGAEVSTVHANFIVNKDEATSKDIAELIKLVQAQVKEKTNIELETEVLFLGDV